MYEEYLGEGYHDKIRKMLTLPDEVLPNRIIDADLNIGGMKHLLSPIYETVNVKKYQDTVERIAVYYLCGILCMAMKSRTSAPPFNKKKYQKNWDKKRINYMTKGNKLMQGLMIGGAK